MAARIYPEALLDKPLAMFEENRCTSHPLKWDPKENHNEIETAHGWRRHSYFWGRSIIPRFRRDLPAGTAAGNSEEVLKTRPEGARHAGVYDEVGSGSRLVLQPRDVVILDVVPARVEHVERI
jgi:hypothetical protein